MSHNEDKWEHYYASAELSSPAEPAWVLRQHAHSLPLHGHALDLACGLGGNARFLARCGLSTQAWDKSSNAVALVNKWSRLQGLQHHLNAEVKDLTQIKIPSSSFDVIVVSRFLQPSLFADLADALRPNGVLFYQTFLAPIQAQGPSNPAFYVASGEFNQAWSSKLITEVYGEGWVHDSGTNAQRMAWFIGRKRLNPS